MHFNRQLEEIVETFALRLGLCNIITPDVSVGD